MAALPNNSNPDRGGERMPRWVKVSGIVSVLLILSCVVLHLAGGGFRGHLP